MGGSTVVMSIHTSQIHSYITLFYHHLCGQKELASAYFSVFFVMLYAHSIHAFRDVWVERLDASDRIISTLLKYQYINGSSEADYSLKCLQTWREELKESLNRQAAAPQNGQGRTVTKKQKKKNIKAKRMFAKMGLQQRADEEEDTGVRVERGSEREREGGVGEQ